MYVEKQMVVRAFTILITLVPWLVQPADGAAPTTSWPQWRGPDRDGVIQTDRPWPKDFSTLKKSWRVELAPGYSGPIVAPDRVFVAETLKKKYEIVRALDRATGEELWKASWKGAMSVPFFARSNGDWIRSTPAFDGKSLFVAGMRDVLVCLDAETGKETWRVDFCKRYGTDVPGFGCVCSPMLDGDSLYLQAGMSFCKIDKNTGKTIWRTLVNDHSMMESAFSSPIKTTLCGREQIVVQMRQELCGVDPGTGDVLWRTVVPSYRGMNILTPAVYRDGIFTSTHRNATYFYQVSKEDQKFSVKEAWKHSAQGYMSSPVIVGDYAYCHLGNGRAACFDLRSGEETWRSKPFGKYWSMVTDRTKILALDERGDLILLRANPEKLEMLDKKRVADQECWGHIAIAGNEIFIRELNAVSAFRWSGAGSRG